MHEREHLSLKEIVRPNGLAISEFIGGAIAAGAGDFMMEDVPPSKLVVGLFLGAAALMIDGVRRMKN